VTGAGVVDLHFTTMIDLSAVQPEMNPELIERTRAYLAVVDAGDLDMLETFYAPDFVNIRYDRTGRAVNLPLDAFMGILRGWASEDQAAPSGVPVPPQAEETRIVATTQYGEYASVLMLRIKGGETLAYNFVWRYHDDEWRVLREFTLHDVLPVPEN